jgi:hypothetical protein
MASPPAAAPIASTHITAPAHPVGHVPASNVTPVVPHRRPSNPGPSNPTTSGTGNSGHGNPGGSHCTQHFSYPIQGLSACPPSGGGAAFYGGAYYIPVPYYYSDTSAQDQGLPEGDVEQVTAEAPSHEADQQDANAQESDPHREPAEESRAPASSSNINDALAQFVFVDRDGSSLYAVAYSFLNDQLQYVTKEGVRHSVAVDSLDLDATLKCNEQLGNTINLPNLPPSGVALNEAPAPLP